MPVNQLSSVELQDLVAVIDLYHAMWNTHHLDGVLSCFADDAMVTISGLSRKTSAVYQGKTEIRAFVQQHLGEYTIRARSHHVVGDRIVWMILASSEALQRARIDWIRCRGEAAVRHDKLTSLTVTVTPEATAKLEMATAAGVNHLREQFSTL